MKFLRVVAVLQVLTFSLMVPSFAWDNQSFVGDSVYFYDAVNDTSDLGISLFADSSSSSSSTTSSGSLVGYDFLSSLSLSYDQYYVGFYEYWVPPTTVAGVSIPGYTAVSLFPNPTPAFTSSYNSSSEVVNFFGGSNITVPSHASDGEEVDRYFSRGAVNRPTESGDSAVPPSVFPYLSVSLDLSSFGEFYAFSLSGAFHADFRFRAGSFFEYQNVSISLYVNDALARTFYPQNDEPYNTLTGVLDFSDFVYSGAAPITSIEFRLAIPQLSASAGDTLRPYFSIYATDSSYSAPRFDILTGSDVISDQAGSTQDDINSVDSVESQWGDNMMNNFNSLNVENFSYPDGLVSAFSMISGLFQDLWSTLGSYQILYVFPLTLAIVLLVIGRISKFSGRSGRDKGG